MRHGHKFQDNIVLPLIARSRRNSGILLKILCSESEAPPSGSTSNEVHSSSDNAGVGGWVTNTARNFLISLFGTQSPFRAKDLANTSSQADLEAPNETLAPLQDRPRADRFLSVIRNGVQRGLFDVDEEQGRDWARVEDERVNREEFGEAVMAAGLSDMGGVDIDDLFQGMDADHDGELRFGAHTPVAVGLPPPDAQAERMRGEVTGRLRALPAQRACICHESGRIPA